MNANNDIKVSKAQFGIVPLFAFFIGLVLTLVALLINSSVPHYGGWSDLSKLLWEGVILGVAWIYALVFALWSLIIIIFYKDESGIPNRNAIYALLLNGGYVIIITILFLFELSH